MPTRTSARGKLRLNRRRKLGTGKDSGTQFERRIEDMTRYNARQIVIGVGVTEKQYRVDILARNKEDSTESIPVSIKWQEVGGTTADKMFYEILSLTKILGDKKFRCAYIVVGGDAVEMDYYLSQKYKRAYSMVPNIKNVHVISEDVYRSKIERGLL